MSRMRVLVVASVMVGLLMGALGSRAGAASRCERRYRDLALPVYDRVVTAFHYHHLSCGSAARIGSAVADAYERGLPPADYPPPPNGVPGGQGHTFKVPTRKYGTYTCRMTERGSDFVGARCRRGARFVSSTRASTRICTGSRSGAGKPCDVLVQTPAGATAAAAGERERREHDGANKRFRLVPRDDGSRSPDAGAGVRHSPASPTNACSSLTCPWRTTAHSGEPTPPGPPMGEAYGSSAHRPYACRAWR